ncbi:MAG: lipoprotein-releasing system transmembrane subunit LolC, partial [Rhodospirillales bacterium]|nr:lipoprotein-releasing system transmembrane subunit LolC [Rhodospirillales bacterium]
MFSAFEWMLAMRYLRARRQEGFISVIAWFSLLGIGLGVATLIIVMSVMNGFREELLSRILGINGHLNVSAQSRSLTDYEPLRERLQAVPGVIAVSPLVEGQVMATHNGVSQGAVVRGLEPSDLRGRELVASNIVAGDLSSFEGNNSIVIGRRLARKLGVPVGGNVNLISPKGTVTAFGTVPRMKSYQVVALFDVGMYEYDSNLGFIDLDASQKFFGMKGQATGIEIRIHEIDDAAIIGETIK